MDRPSGGFWSTFFVYFRCNISSAGRKMFRLPVNMHSSTTVLNKTLRIPRMVDFHHPTSSTPLPNQNRRGRRNSFPHLWYMKLFSVKVIFHLTCCLILSGNLEGQSLLAPQVSASSLKVLQLAPHPIWSPSSLLKSYYRITMVTRLRKFHAERHPYFFAIPH